MISSGEVKQAQYWGQVSGGVSLSQAGQGKRATLSAIVVDAAAWGGNFNFSLSQLPALIDGKEKTLTSPEMGLGISRFFSVQGLGSFLGGSLRIGSASIANEKQAETIIVVRDQSCIGSSSCVLSREEIGRSVSTFYFGIEGGTYVPFAENVASDLGLVLLISAGKQCLSFTDKTPTSCFTLWDVSTGLRF